METGTILLGLLVVVFLTVGYWYTRKQEIKAEENRVSQILANQSEWGVEMCQWLINNKHDATSLRISEIMSNFRDWGQDTCQKLIRRSIDIDMTVEMVKLAIGKPYEIDNKVKTAKDEKYRFIYGIPRQGATYIWFKNDKVVKIKQ